MTNYEASLIMASLPTSTPFPVSGSYILLSTLFSDTHNLCPSGGATDKFEGLCIFRFEKETQIGFYKTLAGPALLCGRVQSV